MVDSYTISYNFLIVACQEIAEGSGTISMTGFNGTLRMYTLTDLKADTDYTITVVAVNGAGTSEVSNEAMTSTGVQGE